MVEAAWCLGTRRSWIALGIALCGPGLAGCSFVPKSRLDECHHLSQTLQAENNRLRDTAISLRSQNQDLNQRAVEDARRLRVQEEEIQRLVQSVSAYQEDRDQLAAAFDRIKSQIRTASGPVSSGLFKRLADVAQAHNGWEFDPERNVLMIPAAQLFEAGSDRLRSEAEVGLAETAALWTTPEGRGLDVLVVGRSETSAVRRAALEPQEAQGRTRSQPLGLARAARVRDLLIKHSGIDPGRIEVAGFEVPHDGPDTASASHAPNRRIEIHFRAASRSPLTSD
jgi:chemotaxis protein MotB